MRAAAAAPGGDRFLPLLLAFGPFFGSVLSPVGPVPKDEGTDRGGDGDE